MTTNLKAVDSVNEVIHVNFTECQTMLATLNGKSPNPYGIKDLRLLHSLAQYVESAIPKMPEKFKASIPEKAKDEKYTKEEMDIISAEAEQYNQKTKEFFETEFPLTLTSIQKNILKQRMSIFTEFFSNVEARKSILGIADKLGV